MNLKILDVTIKIIRNGKVVDETVNLPAYTEADEGKVLGISEGALAWTELGSASPILFIENLDKENKIPLRSLDSGTYILYGYFTTYEGATDSCTFGSNQLVSIRKSTSNSAVQIFWPPNNTIQYLYITDNSVERRDAKLYWMESTTNKVTAIDASSDDDHYPSAKAVWDAISGLTTRIETLESKG